MTDNIFDATGMLRTDLENVQVPQERRPVFNALVAAVRAAEEAERALKIKDEAVAEAVKVYDRAVAARPKWTQHDEWLVMTGKQVDQPHKPVSPYVVRDAENALGIARQELRDARQTVAYARTEVAKRLADYNATVPTITPEQNVRDHIASENARRQAVAEGRARPGHRTRPGPSYLDRAAFYGTHGGADDFVRRRFQYGAHRGAFSKSSMGAPNTDPARGPTVKRTKG